MNEKTSIPTPPFTAYVNGRGWDATQIVRETATQWVSENGWRWRKKDRNLVGNTDPWFFQKLVIPGDDNYEQGRQAILVEGLKTTARSHLQKASERQGSYEERAKHARLAADALDALRDMEAGA